jgi:hypothetical protein
MTLAPLVTKVVVGHSFDPLVIYGVEIGDVVRKLINNCKFTQRTGGGSGSWGGGGSHGFVVGLEWLRTLKIIEG